MAQSRGAAVDAGTGARTRMGLLPRDFKSLASAYFATPAEMAKGSGRLRSPSLTFSRAGNGTRTRDPNLGKVVLYQLSYSRLERSIYQDRRQRSQWTGMKP